MQMQSTSVEKVKPRLSVTEGGEDCTGKLACGSGACRVDVEIEDGAIAKGRNGHGRVASQRDLRLILIGLDGVTVLQAGIRSGHCQRASTVRQWTDQDIRSWQ